MNAATKARLVRRFQKYMLNPVSKPLAGFVGPALLETTGRKTGKRRRVPVGATRQDGALWIASEHGRRSDYVRNIEADPRVRVRHRGRWHEGTAHIVDDADARLYARGLNGLFVRMVGSELLTIRIDLRS